MSRSTKIVLGVLTVLPTLMLFGLLAIVFGMLFGVYSDLSVHTEPNEELLVGNMFYIIGLSIGLGTLSFAMLVYYIVHVITNKKIDNNIQVVWILILLFTSPIGSMVYWYVNIWREQPVSDSIGPASVSGYSN